MYYLFIEETAIPLKAFPSVLCEEGWRTGRSRCVSGQDTSRIQKGCCVCHGFKRRNHLGGIEKLVQKKCLTLFA